MEILFDDEKVKKIFDDHNLMIRKTNFEITKLVKKKIHQLIAFECFKDYLDSNIGKPHLLEGKDKEYAINVTANIRLIIKPYTESLDFESLKKCKKIIIKGVVDYHGSNKKIYIP